jgi:hypothetical protein
LELKINLFLVFLSEAVIIVFILFFNKDDISEKDEDDCKGRVIK